MASHTLIDRYEVKAELGRGGMATVYHAHDPRFDREVAIKVMPREFLHDPTFRARFEREAKAIASIQHPHILPVYDFGEHDGQPYIVMAHMPGGSLSGKLAAGGLPLDETSRIITQIASAIDEAHAAGIIHRDLKPANILFDKRGNAYLSDFGIARLTEATAQLTGTGIVGTPAYMAPEMAYEGGLSPLVDVYALGVTLYQMLAGQVPYKADTPMGVLMAHASRPIPDLRQMRPDLPDSLQAVLERAMAKDPADRYQSAGELAAGLNSAVSVGTQRAASLPADPTPAPADPHARTMDVPASRREPTRKEPPPTQRETVKKTAPTTRKTGINPLWWMIGGLALVAVIGIGMAVVGFGAVTAGLFGRGVSVPEINPVPTLIAVESAHPLAKKGVTANADWTPYTEEKSNGVTMALVPAGCFLMGSEDGDDDEQPIRKVCFDTPFWMDATEVTNQQYGSSGSWSGDYLPRENVSWTDAQAHCEKRGARLPTEAEWEYAARGPDGLVYPWGNTFVTDNVVYFNNSDAQTASVGSRPVGASWVGALDLSGNVWEWVNDWYGAYPSDQQVNPTGPESGDYRVLRGGSWKYAEFYSRTTERNRYLPNRGFGDFGFRCALSY
jgi:serine/threonine-protein kinase